MAKVKIEIDTETGDMTASVNGKAVDNLSYVSAYKYTDNYSYKTPKVVASCSLTSEEVDDKGVRTYTNICAKNSREGIEAMKLGTTAAAHDDFVINPVTPKFEIPSEHIPMEAKEKVSKAFAGFFGNN